MYDYHILIYLPVELLILINDDCNGVCDRSSQTPLQALYISKIREASSPVRFH